MNSIILAVTGASGSIYAKRLLHFLEKKYKILVVFSKNAIEIYQSEVGSVLQETENIKIYDNNDFSAPFASGSCQIENMIICPCSMGTLSRIACGISDTLITRAADVMLKERRKLILVPRETPYNLIHLRNMETLTLSGAIICPASPSFYSKPKTIQEAVDTVVFRILDLLRIENNSTRWGESL